MNEATYKALVDLYCAMLREQGEWRIANQGFYCDVRDLIAAHKGFGPDTAQNIVEQFALLRG